PDHRRGGRARGVGARRQGCAGERNRRRGVDRVAVVPWGHILIAGEPLEPCRRRHGVAANLFPGAHGSIHPNPEGGALRVVVAVDFFLCVWAPTSEVWRYSQSMGTPFALAQPFVVHTWSSVNQRVPVSSKT